MQLAMPAEWPEHQRCLMGWPGRDQVPERLIAEAREAHGAIARTLVEHEPVLMIAHPGLGRQAAHACGPRVDVLEVPLGTAWMRDAAPLFAASVWRASRSRSSSRAGRSPSTATGR